MRYIELTQVAVMYVTRLLYEVEKCHTTSFGSYSFGDRAILLSAPALPVLSQIC